MHFVPRRTAKGSLCRAFIKAHDKELIFAVRFLPAHGKERHTPSHPDAVSCFFCRAL
jgi:hypothetical protein